MAATLTEETLAAARSKHPAALQEIYRRLAPSVLSYLTSKGCEDPEALTQDVFLTVFSKLGSVTGGGEGLRSFVFSVAHARMVDDVRRRERRPLTLEFRPDFDVRVTASAEESVLGSGSGVSALLHGLNPAQQEVLLLRIVADLSIDESAQIMGRTPGSVKQLQRRALEILRTRLVREEVLENEQSA